MIYSAKFLKKGLVTTGIYRKFRHPQYVSLTLFGLGILLTWGRFITYIAFFIMIWLYYFLSKSEERKCLALYGSEYEAYLRRTWFLFPGESVLCSFLQKASALRWPTWVKVTSSFGLVIALALGSGFFAQKVKQNFRKHPPVIEGAISLSEDGRRTVKLFMVKGPALQAAPFKSVHNPFWENVYDMLISSSKIKQALFQLGLEDNHSLFVFLTPGSNWQTGAHRDYQKAKVNAYMVLAETSLGSQKEEFFKQSHAVNILQLIRAKDLSCGRWENGLDPVEGEVIMTGPPLGIVNVPFQQGIHDRINFFLSGM